ncbi:MAG: HYR domain-containing protein, partial [Bacteroidia bacterium]
PSGGTILGIGSTTVTMTASDLSGNTTTCAFSVAVLDNAPPSLTCPGAQTLPLDTNCLANLPAYDTMAIASDNCTASPGIVQSPAAGSMLLGGGTTSVSLTATDASGNTSTCAFTVLRQENTPPSLQCPANQTIYLDATCQVSLPDFESVTNATDNCTANPILSQSPAPGTVFSGLGTASVAMTAADSAGNASTCAFVVTRADTSAPTLTCPPSIIVTPTFVTCQMPVSWAMPSANDNCSVSVSSTHQSGDVFPVGTTTVMYTAQDPSGNTTTCAFTVQVMPPALSGTTSSTPVTPCQGDTVTLTAISGASQYQWSTGQTSPSIVTQAGGWYWVDIQLGPGCVTRDSVFVAFAPNPQPMVFQSGNLACTGAFATYQWYLNGQLLAGENGPCTTLGQSGTYSVSVTDSNGCGAVSSGLVLVGGEEADAMQISIYPNPADHAVIVNVPFLPTESMALELFDLAGRRLFELGLEPRAGDHRVELSAVSSGHYFARLRHGLSFQTIRIVVLHEMK